MTTQTSPADTAARWHPKRARGIHRRLLIAGDLVALSPLHLGSGESDEAVDLPLLRDEPTGRPLLCGSSLAGALRSHLIALAAGDGTRHAETEDLFGSLDVGQSAVLIEDALGEWPDAAAGAELRNGVAINDATRTAEENALYAIEVWPAGTRFRIKLELLLDSRAADDSRLAALLTALSGLHGRPGGITLGARARRGFGRVEVRRWQVSNFNLCDPAGLRTWLARWSADDDDAAAGPTGEALGRLAPFDTVAAWPDERQATVITLTCGLSGSLLVRGVAGSAADPDDAYMQAHQAGGGQSAILPGTSLGGALRARALRIVNTIGAPPGLLYDIFGPPPGGQAGVARRQAANAPATRASAADKPTLWAGRLVVSEQVIEDATTNLVQNRVAIDRFTGGAFPTALFDEQPAFARPETTLRLTLRLAYGRDDSADAEIGLLLLLVKDLWTSDLPLGGEQSVGRGRLYGREASLSLPDGSSACITQAEADENVTERPPLHVQNGAALERYVRALHEWIAHSTPDMGGRTTEGDDGTQD